MDEAARDGMSQDQLLLELAGIKESGISKIIKESRTLLGLNTFYTAGPTGISARGYNMELPAILTYDPEARAWSISQGTKAREAAGQIHSDIAKGFIKAEVCVRLLLCS